MAGNGWKWMEIAGMTGIGLHGLNGCTGVYCRFELGEKKLQCKSNFNRN